MTTGLRIDQFRGLETRTVHRAHVTRASTQSIAASTATDVQFTAEVYDHGDLVDLSTSATDIVVVEAGTYGVSGGNTWASDSAGRRAVHLEHDRGGSATALGGVTANADGVGAHELATQYVEFDCEAGDIWRLVVTHTSTTTPLNLTAARLLVRRVA